MYRHKKRDIHQINQFAPQLISGTIVQLNGVVVYYRASKQIVYSGKVVTA